MILQFLQTFSCTSGTFEMGSIVDWEPYRDIPVPWLSVIARDQSGLDCLCYWAGPDNVHRLQFSPGLSLPKPGFETWDMDEVTAQAKYHAAQNPSKEWDAALLALAASNAKFKRLISS